MLGLASLADAETAASTVPCVSECTGPTPSEHTPEGAGRVAPARIVALTSGRWILSGARDMQISLADAEAAAILVPCVSKLSVLTPSGLTPEGAGRVAQA